MSESSAGRRDVQVLPLTTITINEHVPPLPLSLPYFPLFNAAIEFGVLVPTSLFLVRPSPRSNYARRSQSGSIMTNQSYPDADVPFPSIPSLACLLCSAWQCRERKRSIKKFLFLPPSLPPSIGCVHLNDSACSSSFSFPSPLLPPAPVRSVSVAVVVQISAAPEFLLPPTLLL